MDSAQREYTSFLQRCERFGNLEKHQTYKMLYLPKRIQMNMESLYTAFQYHRPAFEKRMNLSDVFGQPTVTLATVFGLQWNSTNPDGGKYGWRLFIKSCTRCSMQNLSKECNNLQRIRKQRLVWMKKQLRNELLAGFVNV
ncbi:unnamed protein product [Peronospora destructor]|uniref:Uncharacterized protein n=1 Tax=Peronospora destructor TaxID=86335 RepID=A0AAV0U548_9STRA|nr:unnamed protein product [Peronospora destructor]